jgi:hypothetical protein
MGAWYTIGLFVGLGVACGVLLAGLLAGGRGGAWAAIVLGAIAGAALGIAFSDWPQAVGGAVGGVLGAAGAAQIVAGTLRHGGTRAGTAVLFAVGALVLAALALVPVVGYLEAIVVPALAVRLRRRTDSTYAGLRILARD